MAGIYAAINHKERMNTVSTATFKDTDLSEVMERMPYGCYIVGSHDKEGEPNGMMADWVMQVSFSPRMVAVALENDAHTLANIRQNRSFTVNMLPRDEAGRRLSAKFAQPFDGGKVLGRSNAGSESLHHKLDGIRFSPSATGSPVLDDSAAWFECEAHQFVPASDHTIVTGRVVHGRLVGSSDVLTAEYAGWSYSG